MQRSRNVTEAKSEEKEIKSEEKETKSEREAIESQPRENRKRRRVESEAGTKSVKISNRIVQEASKKIEDAKKSDVYSSLFHDKPRGPAKTGQEANNLFIVSGATGGGGIFK